RRAAILPSFAFTGQTYTIAVVHTGRNLDRQRLVLLHAPAPLAATARLLDLLAGTATGRTRLLDRKMAARHAHLAIALTSPTGNGLGTGLRARTFAGIADHQRRQLEVDGIAENRLLQGQSQL